MKVLELSLFLFEKHFVDLKIDRNISLNSPNFFFKTIIFENEVNSAGGVSSHFKKHLSDFKKSNFFEKICFDKHYIFENLKKYESDFNETSWPEIWRYHIIKHILAFDFVKNNISDEYDFYVISDIDEILAQNFIEIINNTDVDLNNKRIGQDWYIGSPFFKYRVLWPGPLIFSKKQFFSSSSFELAMLNQVRDQYILKSGWHMTYLGQDDIFKKKSSNSSEKNNKRVRLANHFGLFMMKLGIDPFLRKPFVLNIEKDNLLNKLLKNYYKDQYIEPYF